MLDFKSSQKCNRLVKSKENKYLGKNPIDAVFWSITNKTETRFLFASSFINASRALFQMGKKLSLNFELIQLSSVNSVDYSNHLDERK